MGQGIVYHKELKESGRWSSMSFFEQMGNIGSEVSRACKWKEKGKPEMMQKAFERGLELLDFPFVGMLGRPHLCREQLGVFVLNNAPGVGRNAFAAAAGPFDDHLVVLSVVYIAGTQPRLPDAVGAGQTPQLEFLHRPPVAEVAYESYSGCAGRPFAENPSAALGAVEPEIFVGIGEFGQRTAGLGQFALFVDDVVVAALDGSFERLEPRVVFYDFKILHV